MKIVSKKPASQSAVLAKQLAPAKSTVTKRLADGTIRIWHTQEINQSANFQSIRCSYGAEITVDGTEEALKNGIVTLEEIVEKALVAKVQDQMEVLVNLSSK